MLNSSIKCIRCSKIIKSPRRNQRFCSKACRNKRPRLKAHEWNKRTAEEIAEYKRSNHLNRNLKRFGWTTESFRESYLAQEGKCAICKREVLLVADHDHNTGLKRKLLCHNCN